MRTKIFKRAAVRKSHQAVERLGLQSHRLVSALRRASTRFESAMQSTTLIAFLATSLLAVYVHAQTEIAVAASSDVADSSALDAIQHALVIEGSQIGGDLMVIDGTNIKIVGSSIQGSVTLQNGCKVQNDEVQECDGSRRRMSRPEQAKMRKRVAQIKRRQRAFAAKGAGRKGAASKARAGRRPTASKAASGKKARQTPKARAAAFRRRNAGFTPCNSCPTDGGDAGGDEEIGGDDDGDMGGEE